MANIQRRTQQHPFVRTPFGRCGYKESSNGPDCGKDMDHTLHRTYMCKDRGHPPCTQIFWSIESRDRHHANKHGAGW